MANSRVTEGGVVHILHEPDAVALQRGGRSTRIVRLEIGVEVLSPLHELDEGVLRIHAPPMETLVARPGSVVRNGAMTVEILMASPPGRALRPWLAPGRCRTDAPSTPMPPT
jgi:hypothetical protein